MNIRVSRQDMEDEFNQLHAVFQKLAELHSHLKKFKGTVPPQYTTDVKRLLEIWKFQKHFVKPQLPNHLYEPFSQMQTHVSGFFIDFYLDGILHQKVLGVS
jgi:hypothetical protein